MTYQYHSWMIVKHDSAITIAIAIELDGWWMSYHRMVPHKTAHMWAASTDNSSAWRYWIEWMRRERHQWTAARVVHRATYPPLRTPPAMSARSCMWVQHTDISQWSPHVDHPHQPPSLRWWCVGVTNQQQQQCVLVHWWSSKHLLPLTLNKQQSGWADNMIT